MRIRNALALLAVSAACVGTGGCVTSPARARHGKTFYVGGAGYIGPMTTFDVVYGLWFAGYRGQVEPFIWQSGKGALADQLAFERNRARARELAARMKAYLDAYPRGALNVVALSAGCGVTAFAVESLPDQYKLNNVVFLGSSLSKWYDLTKLLRHLRGSLYVYYSPSDLVLSQIVPITGTVDRRADPPAGCFGFSPPPHLTEEGRRLYSKLVNIGWRPEFAKYGYLGQHVDATHFRFIRHEVAKRIMTPPLEKVEAGALVRQPGAPPPAARRLR